jgi:protein-disulfide isomerase
MLRLTLRFSVLLCLVSSALVSTASAGVGGLLTATTETLRLSGLQMSNMGGTKLTDTVMFAYDGTKVNLSVRGSLRTRMNQSLSGGLTNTERLEYVESASVSMPTLNPALAGKILSSLIAQDVSQSLAEYLGRSEVRQALAAGLVADASPFNVALKTEGKGLSMTVTLQQKSGFAAVPANRALGDPAAAHVIRMYSDFQCPYCQKAEREALPEVLKTLPKDVRFEFHHVPLTQIHPNALPAAEASVCAANQGRFFEFKDALFSRNDWQKSITPGTVFLQVAQQAGVNLNRYNTCIQTRQGKAEVEAGLAEANQIGINGTPTVFIDGYQVANAYEPASYQALLDFVQAR